MKLRTIDPTSLEATRGKRVLLRLSLNVPIADGVIRDDFRIIKSLPTLQALVEAGAHVTVISHLGSDGTASLTPVEKCLRKMLPGDYVVQENLRKDPREQAGDESYARELTQDFDIFVNEDFPASHRAHASIVALPKFLPSYVGLQFAKEVEHLTPFLNPPAGSILVLGGAKLSTKLPLIESFLPKVERIYLGSYYLNERDKLPNSEKIVLPVDSVIEGGVVLDVGPRTLEVLQRAVREARAVIWNGPLGKFETGHDKSTLDFARALASSDAKSVVGGGDSISAIRKLELLDKFTFVSTGGGAMLDFLTHGTLPGIEAILNSPLS